MIPETLLESVLEQCQADGVTVALDAGKLVITGQQTALDEWRPVLRELKPELLEMMTRTAGPSDRRTAAFVRRGIDPNSARALELRLATRDAQYDERRLCLECRHLLNTTGVRRCAQWRRARLGGPDLPRELPSILQRCKGFHLADMEPSRQPPHNTTPAGTTAPARPATCLEGVTP